MTFSSIKTKMILSVFLLAFFLSFITAVFALLYFEKNVKESISRQQSAIVTLMADSLDDKLAIAQNALSAIKLSIIPEIINNPDKAQRFLDSQISLHSIYDNGICLLSMKGKIIAESPYEPGSQGRDISFREWYAQTKPTKNPIISNAYISTHAPGHPAIILTVPILDTQGEIIAILAGSIDLLGKNNFQNFVNAKIGRTGYVYIIDSNRTIIIHPHKNMIMTKAGIKKLLDKAEEGFVGSGETTDSYGIQMLTTLKRLRAANWILAANYPISEAYSSIYTARMYFLVGVIAAALISALLAWAIMTQLTAPLLALTQHIKDIADRKGVQKPTPIISGDEVGTLAQAFNNLLADLEQQKEFSENLVKCSPIPTFVIDRNHKLLVWNQACEELTGIKSSNILGSDSQMDAFYDKRLQTLADIAIDENFEELASRYSIISESLLIPNGWHGEGWIKNLNGRDRYLLLETTPIYNKKRELIAAIECLQDITENAQMTEALKESEDKFKCIAEQPLTGIFMLQGGFFEYVNPKFADIFGYSVEEYLSNMPFQQLIYPEDIGLVEEQTRMRLTGEILIGHCKIRGLTKNRKRVYLELYESSIVYNKKPASIGSILDITGCKRDEKE
jgi:PAS domain S-box-containing protein